MHVANNCGRGLKLLAFRHLPLFKHPFCRYSLDKHLCLKTGAYGIEVLDQQSIYFLTELLQPDNDLNAKKQHVATTGIVLTTYLKTETVQQCLGFWIELYTT